MPISVPVISAETIVIEPLPEPAATFDAIERVMAGTAGLLSMLLNSPLMTPDMRRTWESQIVMRRNELQAGIIRVAQLSQGAQS